MRKMFLVCAMALATASGSALAGALDEPDNMAPFFTDASMTKIKSPEEMKAVWNAMAPEKQTAMMIECQDAAMSKPYAQFCADLMPLGGAHK
jgi:hypothetical protein